MNWPSFFLGVGAMFVLSCVLTATLFVILIARPLIKDDPRDKTNV